MEQQRKRLFVDMDGTLAVFQKLDTLEALYEQGYFLSLPPIKNVLVAVKTIIAENPEIEVNILSAVLSDSKFALEEKNAWLDKYLPELPKENRIFTVCGEDKKDFIIGGVTENDYLLDDYTKNLTLWSPPGQGIKLLNGLNHTNRTWQGQKLSYDIPSGLLATQISCIISNDNEFERNSGYYILDKNDDYALGFSPSAPSPYVIWNCDVKGGYSNGRYRNSIADLNIAEYGFDETKLYNMANAKDEYKKFKLSTPQAQVSKEKSLSILSTPHTLDERNSNSSPIPKFDGLSYD